MLRKDYREVMWQQSPVRKFLMNSYSVVAVELHEPTGWTMQSVRGDEGDYRVTGLNQWKNDLLFIETGKN